MLKRVGEIDITKSNQCSEPFCGAAIYLNCAYSLVILLYRCSIARTRFALILYFGMMDHKAICDSLLLFFFCLFFFVCVWGGGGGGL